MAIKSLLGKGLTALVKLVTIAVCASILLACFTFFIYLLFSLAVSSKMTIAMINDLTAVDSQPAWMISAMADRSPISKTWPTCNPLL